MSCVLLYFFLISFNWRLITLKYCVGFYHTWTWISHGCICILHPQTPPTSLPILSLWAVPVHLFECPVSCIELGLVIYFTCGNIRVSKLFSQIIQPSPSPSPIESKSLFFISASLLLSRIQGHHYRLSKFHIYICVNILCWCFSFWLTSFCKIGPSFIYLIRTDSNTFCLIAE